MWRDLDVMREEIMIWFAISTEKTCLSSWPCIKSSFTCPISSIARRLKAKTPADYKGYSGYFFTLCLKKFGILMVQSIPPGGLWYSTEPPKKSIFCYFLPQGGQRSGSAAEQPPWRCDGFLILLKDTLAGRMPVDTEAWARLSESFTFDNSPCSTKWLTLSK